MEQLKVTGQVFKVTDKIQKSEKFAMRELWLTYGDKYPQTIAIQFNNDKCDLLNNLQPGELITVGVNLNGRIWNGNDGQKVFNTINGWSIEYSGATKPQNTQPYQERVMESTSQKIERLNKETSLSDLANGDLPF